MCLDVVYQKVGFYDDIENFPYGKANPIWDLAPKCAYYKAKKFCSLLNTLATEGFRAPILHDVERLSINIWRMTKKSYDSLLRLIRSKIVKAAEQPSFRRSPEAAERWGTLTANPICNPNRVYWYPARKMGGDSQFRRMCLSTDVELVRHALYRRSKKRYRLRPVDG
jgi:hypothetical protein